jgi:hypothetical protein
MWHYIFTVDKNAPMAALCDLYDCVKFTTEAITTE